MNTLSMPYGHSCRPDKNSSLLCWMHPSSPAAHAQSSARESQQERVRVGTLLLLLVDLLNSKQRSPRTTLSLLIKAPDM